VLSVTVLHGILLDRQVALLIADNRVVRTIAVSTGKPSTPTPPGDYRVYAKIRRWWSTPFREWLPWALPFVGGIAFHELQDVPACPASHAASGNPSRLRGGRMTCERRAAGQGDCQVVMPGAVD
jgi:L,D-transpeptidase-like protein